MSEQRRVEKFAQFMQQRDARTFEVQDRDGNFQQWDEIGEFGREEYLKDAEAYLRAVDLIDFVDGRFRDRIAAAVHEVNENGDWANADELEPLIVDAVMNIVGKPSDE